ncbi:MAG TPA: hypothetical protein PK890_05900 [Terrimesophilobacter sp.]|nr:hypothetical protein [Terrimesophilobacter sp.]
MDKLPSALIVLSILVLALALMWWGWRARQRRQAGLPSLPPVPANTGAEVFATEAFYVATTERDKPLERIAVGGLGFRARATLRVLDRGVALEIPGQDALFLSFARIESVTRARHAIDRAVERDGLTVLQYSLNASPGGEATSVDSYLRIVDPLAAKRFVDEVAPRVAQAVAQ